MASNLPHITSAELNILKVLWNAGSGTVRDVRDELGRTGDLPAYTTVMTMMNQLAAKNALEVDRTRQPFIYRPAVRREQVLAQRLRQFVQTVFDGQAGELVLRLVGEADLSADDLRRIEARIEERERDDSKPSDCKGGSERSRS